MIRGNMELSLIPSLLFVSWIHFSFAYDYRLSGGSNWDGNLQVEINDRWYFICTENDVTAVENVTTKACYELVPGYIGCFYHTNLNPALTFTSALPANDLTIEGCLSDCRQNGYALAGLAHGVSCFCGNNTDNLRENDDTICHDYPCPGNQFQSCGGGLQISVYETYMGQCGGDFEELSSHYVTSPQFPDEYPRGSYCQWNFNNFEILRIFYFFTVFELRSDDVIKATFFSKSNQVEAIMTSGNTEELELYDFSFQNDTIVRVIIEFSTQSNKEEVGFILNFDVIEVQPTVVVSDPETSSPSSRGSVSYTPGYTIVTPPPATQSSFPIVLVVVPVLVVLLLGILILVFVIIFRSRKSKLPDSSSFGGNNLAPRVPHAVSMNSNSTNYNYIGDSTIRREQETNKMNNVYESSISQNVYQDPNVVKPSNSDHPYSRQNSEAGSYLTVLPDGEYSTTTNVYANESFDRESVERRSPDTHDDTNIRRIPLRTAEYQELDSHVPNALYQALINPTKPPKPPKPGHRTANSEYEDLNVSERSNSDTYQGLHELPKEAVKEDDYMGTGEYMDPNAMERSNSKHSAGYLSPRSIISGQ